MYAHFLYSTSCHKHFCKVNEQKQARRVEHSLYLPCCLKEARIFDCVFSGPLLHSARCSHVLQKDRSVLFITFIPLSPKYPSTVHSGSCFYPVCTPALSPRAAHPVQFLPLSQGIKVIIPSQGLLLPLVLSPGSSGERRPGWCFYTSVERWNICGWLLGWLVFPQFGVYCIFLWLSKAAPIVGQLC